MNDDAALVIRWLDAFNRREVEDLLEVAHPTLVLRPMRWVELSGRSDARGR